MIDLHLHTKYSDGEHTPSEVIKIAKKYTQNVFVFGTSIFRKLEKVELDEINENLKDNERIITVEVN